MEYLPRDLIISIAILLNLPDIIRFCQTSSKFDRIVCKNRNFWILKLKKDYNLDYLNIGHNPEFYYKFFHRYGGLNLLKKPNESLQTAAFLGNKELAKFFIDRGANDIRSAIELSEFYKNYDMANYLREIRRSLD